MNIVFSANNRAEVITFPYAPEGIEINVPQDSEDFDGLSRHLLLIGKIGLRSLSFSGYWFKNAPSWATTESKSKTPEDYVSFFNKWRAQLVPVRCVITKSDGNEFVNLAVIITGFKYSYNRAGDIEYSLEMTEYPFVGVS